MTDAIAKIGKSDVKTMQCEILSAILFISTVIVSLLMNVVVIVTFFFFTYDFCFK